MSYLPLKRLLSNNLLDCSVVYSGSTGNAQKETSRIFCRPHLQLPDSFRHKNRIRQSYLTNGITAFHEAENHTAISVCWRHAVCIHQGIQLDLNPPNSIRNIIAQGIDHRLIFVFAFLVFFQHAKEQIDVQGSPYTLTDSKLKNTADTLFHKTFPLSQSISKYGAVRAFCMISAAIPHPLWSNTLQR